MDPETKKLLRMAERGAQARERRSVVDVVREAMAKMLPPTPPPAPIQFDEPQRAKPAAARAEAQPIEWTPEERAKPRAEAPPPSIDWTPEERPKAPPPEPVRVPDWTPEEREAVAREVMRPAAIEWVPEERPKPEAPKPLVPTLNPEPEPEGRAPAQPDPVEALMFGKVIP